MVKIWGYDMVGLLVCGYSWAFSLSNNWALTLSDIWAIGLSNGWAFNLSKVLNG
jgi:hypothetical protein